MKKTKFIYFANNERAEKVANEMNPHHAWVADNETRGNSYYRWIFSNDAVVIGYEHGEGKANGRFSVWRLIRGTAWKVGRDSSDLDYYGESITVKNCY